jgi:ribosome-binding factor A
MTEGPWDMENYKRTDRLGDQFRMEIADILLKKIKDPRIGFTTVTAVEISVDLRHAKVFVSSLEESAAKERTLEGLKRASGFIRSELGKRLKLRRIPELAFYQDQSMEKAAHLYEVIEGLVKES